MTIVLGDALTSSQVVQKLDKIRWHQELARRGQERKEAVSPELAEALRTEIRNALDAGGKPFDVNVARRVYDLAIAAKDMCVAATDSVKEAIDQIKDTNGPMETLQDPNAPETPIQASETYGARIIKELMALVPKLLPSAAGGGEDPKRLVHALAEARRNGMTDVADELEVKLFGRVLIGARPVSVDVGALVPEGSYDHGFADGQVNAPAASISASYNEGYKEGTRKRLLGEVHPTRENDAHGEYARFLAGQIPSIQARDHGGRSFTLNAKGKAHDLFVYICGCGLPIRQFEKEALDCPLRPDSLVTCGSEPAEDSLAPAGAL